MPKTSDFDGGVNIGNTGYMSDASDITFTPAQEIISIDVENAILELDAEVTLLENYDTALENMPSLSSLFNNALL